MFDTIGLRADCDLTSKVFGNDQLNGQNRLMVDPEYFTVNGRPTVFAIGDTSDIPESKMAYTAGLQGEHLANNTCVRIDIMS